MNNPPKRTKRIRIERLLMPRNVSAGANPLVVMSLAYAMRSTHFDPEPVLVRREGKYYRIEDGRHRFMASVIAGRHNLLCKIKDDY